MKKIGVALSILILLAVLPVLAQEQSVDGAYACLNSQIANKTSESLSLEEAIFSTLALGSKSKLTDKIENEAGENCWPSSGCTIKDTAQALIAYDEINKATGDIESYLLTKNASANELTWYLQIDIEDHSTSTCNIKYDERDYQVQVQEDMTLSGGAGACLSLSSSGYWLQVSRNCHDKEFQISCDKSFITSLLYQKTGSDTIYVSSDTHSSAASGTNVETINSQCFKTSSTCNYEGSLWATIALQQTGYNVDNFLPYLLAFSEDYRDLFPASFLYIITSADDQYTEITNSQKQDGYWEAPGTEYNRFYDTALGLLSLQGTSSQEVETAKNYLLTIQTPEGCWNNNNIRDTAFLLYGGWGEKTIFSDEPDQSALGCVESGYYCEGPFACTDSGGEILNNLDCEGLQACCTVAPIIETCSELNGEVCAFGETCSGSTSPSSDGTCCLGICQTVQTQTECEINEGLCKSSCSSGEEESFYECEFISEVCCLEGEDKGGGGLWIWIIILVILIAIVVLGIIYKDKIKMWWRKRKSKDKGSSQGPPRGLPRGPPRRPSMGIPQRRPPIRRPPMMRYPAGSSSNKELDETLRKLKEMSE